MYIYTHIESACMYMHLWYTSDAKRVLIQVQVPLNTAKKLIMLSADKYDTEFSVTQYVSSPHHSPIQHLLCTALLLQSESLIPHAHISLFVEFRL